MRKVLGRLAQEGMLEHAGGHSSTYRLVEVDSTLIDPTSADGASLDLKFPLQEETYVQLYPKNIAVIAGSPDAGKTAWMLNFVGLNMMKHEIHYFSSEMGALELRNRLQNFDHPLSAWKCKWYDRAANWQDAIVPDAVNIVDYMEIHEEHYRVGSWIKAIFDKLTTGIAVIALQKKKGEEYLAVGGNATLEKARLYISLDNKDKRNTATIVKAKGWVDHDKNPNGLKREYKLAKGCLFRCSTWWE